MSAYQVTKMRVNPRQDEEGAQPINVLKMDRDTLEMALQQAIQGEVRFDAVSRMLYRTDASIYEMEPLGLVVPKDEADVVAAVKIAAEQGAAVLPRGGGTSLAGQSVGAAVHLDFSKYMNRILEFDPDERWVRVQPGLVLDELNAYLQPYGLIFAPDVSTSSRGQYRRNDRQQFLRRTLHYIRQDHRPRTGAEGGAGRRLASGIRAARRRGV